MSRRPVVWLLIVAAGLLTAEAASLKLRQKHYEVKKTRNEGVTKDGGIAKNEGSKLWVGKYLRIMTFNTWNMGVFINDGLKKIAKHIALNDPDIAGLQEVRARDQVEAVVKFLNEDRIYRWSYVYVDRWNCAIVTKHQLNESTLVTVYSGVGVQVILDSKRKVTIYSLHMDYTDYGPYALMYRQMNDVAIVDYGECHGYWTRCANAKELVGSAPFKAALDRVDTEPVFVVGDFNSPSHLDYTEATRHLHGGWVYQWPATFILQNGTGLIDSFRELYPDPVTHPGTSWSTVNQFIGGWNYTIPEPQDRIDYILYRSDNLKTVRSERYAGDFLPYPNPVEDNDWPSDHYAFISDFKGF
ncbi:unnamed protein product [Bursaphelenchus xylophilus]|uniref:(pine wood nematode) hypothetical protein n=1 Tax=Bursaphelenchus xylophilus TaxID=6326 RepID=A0A1I7SBV5_BURXY|nr:unnamed protein product [Bursaphelenchus xylophilus]CAG9112994.1 unnamed protein product [Bursaphelenchus xylophilus]